MILTADWHLTDLPKDEYRWRAFDALHALLQETGPTAIYHLGDLGDRKDKHSAVLANRMQSALMGLAERTLSVDIIEGNHDAPMTGPSYWSTLSNTRCKNLFYHVVPTIVHNDRILLLPFTKHPIDAWEDFDFTEFDALFIHQPVTGASSKGFKLSGYEMPIFPRKLKVYAGDIHEPQTVGRVQYVGAPHHIDFGDEYKCRMLVLNDDTLEIEREIVLSPPAKQLAVISSPRDLSTYDLAPGDQLKVRLSIAAAELADWPMREAEVMAWAKAKGVSVSSIEAVIQEQYKGRSVVYEGEADPLNILAEYGLSEGLSDAAMAVGADCLTAVLKGA